MLFLFVPGDLDLWPLTLTFKLSQRGTKHVFRVNLAQIRSAVPEMFHTKVKCWYTSSCTDWRRQKQNLPQFTASGNNRIDRYVSWCLRPKLSAMSLDGHCQFFSWPGRRIIFRRRIWAYVSDGRHVATSRCQVNMLLSFGQGKVRSAQDRKSIKQAIRAAARWLLSLDFHGPCATAALHRRQLIVSKRKCRSSDGGSRLNSVSIVSGSCRRCKTGTMATSVASSDVARSLKASTRGNCR